MSRNDAYQENMYSAQLAANATLERIEKDLRARLAAAEKAQKLLEAERYGMQSEVDRLRAALAEHKENCANKHRDFGRLEMEWAHAKLALAEERAKREAAHKMITDIVKGLAVWKTGAVNLPTETMLANLETKLKAALNGQ